MVITFDYLLCILLVFPALCIYDRLLVNDTKTMWLSFGEKNPLKHGTEDSAELEGEDSKASTKSWSNCILSYYYKVMHRLRFPLLILAITAIVVCSFVASTIPPRSTPFQMIFKPSTNNRYELHRSWSRLLLSTRMALQDTGTVNFIFGLTPADTGNHYDPDDISGKFASILISDYYCFWSVGDLRPSYFFLRLCVESRIH